MDTKDLIMLNLGIGIADTILDRIVEKFDVELEDADIEVAIRSNYYELGNVGNTLIRCLYEKVIEKGVGEYGLIRRLFSYYLNMSDSHLCYNGKELYGIEDLENLQFEKPEDDNVEDNNNTANNDETMLYRSEVSKLPFDNIRDLYNDLENWKEKTLRIAERMPY